MECFSSLINLHCCRRMLLSSHVDPLGERNTRLNTRPPIILPAYVHKLLNHHSSLKHYGTIIKLNNTVFLTLLGPIETDTQSNPTEWTESQFRSDHECVDKNGNILLAYIALRSDGVRGLLRNWLVGVLHS